MEPKPSAKKVCYKFEGSNYCLDYNGAEKKASGPVPTGGLKLNGTGLNGTARELSAKKIKDETLPEGVLQPGAWGEYVGEEVSKDVEGLLMASPTSGWSASSPISVAAMATATGFARVKRG